MSGERRTRRLEGILLRDRKSANLAHPSLLTDHAAGDIDVSWVFEPGSLERLGSVKNTSSVLSYEKLENVQNRPDSAAKSKAGTSTIFLLSSTAVGSGVFSSSGAGMAEFAYPKLRERRPFEEIRNVEKKRGR